MLIKTSEETIEAKLRSLVELCILAEANTADEFTRLGKARAMVEMTTKSLR